MAGSIVVPTDHGCESARALRVAADLANRAGLPVELLHVRHPDAPADTARELEGPDGVPWTATIVHHEDRIEGLAGALAARPDALVVLGTTARGPVAELLLGSVSEALLATVEQPLLLVGPHVPAGVPVGPVLAAAVAGRRTGDLLVDPVVDWARCFDAEPWFVQVTPPHGWYARPMFDTFETGLVRHLAAKARAAGVDAQWDVLHGRDPVPALVDFVADMGGGAVAVASERWAAPDRVRWASTARSLVHTSPFPVLVIPVRAGRGGRRRPPAQRTRPTTTATTTTAPADGAGTAVGAATVSHAEGDREAT